MEKEPQKLPFASEEFKNAWNEWIEYRKERRLPKYVPRGLKMTFSKLVRESDNHERTAIKMIENSMEQNYQGIFKITIYGNKSDNKGKSSGAYELLEEIRSTSTNNR